MTDDRGNVSVLLAALVVVGVLLCGAVAGLGSAGAAKARANNAADAAALAAAGVLALGQTPAAACAMARRTAAENGARLVGCACRAALADVTVALGAARAFSRAEVDALETP
jgi:secretion/DNA translocation related TadE-like protein